MKYRAHEEVSHLMSREVYDDSLDFIKAVDEVLERQLLADLGSAQSPYL